MPLVNRDKARAQPEHHGAKKGEGIGGGGHKKDAQHHLKKGVIKRETKTAQ